MVRFLKIAFWAFVVATPVAGFWLASSLAAFSGFSLIWAALAGLLLFPVLPLGWLGLSAFRRRGVTSPHVLTFGDRLLWRTLLLNVAFLAIVLWRFPQQSFLAISTRGDWMVEGRSGQGADLARRTLLATANGIEWLYVRAHPNPYAKDGEKPPPPPPATETPVAIALATTPEPEASPVASAHASPAATVTATARPTPAPARSSGTWPAAATLDPLVSSMPSSVETSPDSIGRFLGTQLRDDPMRRAKAVHDYVADRIAYDYEALKLARIPDADAEAEPVWRNRKGVCAGYANLFAVIAKAADLEAVYLTGDARNTIDGTIPGSHAWNAVKIHDVWYLLDATWDAGSSDPSDGGETFHKSYSTLYLFTPPSVFGLDHFPDQEGWQLRSSPMARSEFVRQPLITPQFMAQGLELIAPDRPLVDANGSLDLRVKNPNGLSLLVTARQGTHSSDCRVSGDSIAEAHCIFDSPGAYHVSVFSNRERMGRHGYVAGVDVNDR